MKPPRPRRVEAGMAAKPVWKTKSPTAKRPTKLTEASKARARARAARAGRRYPNMVDNMWAAQQQAGTAKKPTTARKQPTTTARKQPAK